MPRTYGRPSRSGAFAWFAHRITGTFLLFLLITHFWVQHYDRRTASITHSVVTGAEAEAGVLPRYPQEATDAVRERQAPIAAPDEGRAVPAAQTRPEPGPPDAGVTPYDVLMLRLGDPVYAVLWKAFNLLFLLFALHHGFHGLANILTDYIRNDLLRVVATTLSWTVALGLLIVGSYSVITAGL
jgi:succinate dehydrogenase / fumarate reductase membrane anchor subunit